MVKRLTLKPDLTLFKSSFPRPCHSLFPDQAASNDLIIKTLSSEIAEAMKLAREAESAVQEYHHRLEAVKRAETLQRRIQDILEQFDHVSNKFANGVQGIDGQGDGSPPDLNTKACLDPIRHTTFLAMFPSWVQEYDRLDQETNSCLIEAEATFARLKILPGIDDKFMADLTSLITRLSNQRQSVRLAKEDIVNKVQRLKEARHFGEVLSKAMDAVEDVQAQVIDALERQRWRKSSARNNTAPDTPDSDSPQLHSAPFPFTSVLDQLSNEMHTWNGSLSEEVETNFRRLSLTLEAPLSSYLRSSSEGVLHSIQNVHTLISLCRDVIKQATAMSDMLNDASELGYKINEILNELEDKRQVILEGNFSPDEVCLLEHDLSSRVSLLQDAVQAFNDGMASRIPLLGYSNGMKKSSRSAAHAASSINSEERLCRLMDVAVPFNISVSNTEIRDEANAVAMRLTNNVQSVLRSLNYLHAASLAKVTDGCISQVTDSLNSAETTIFQMDSRLSSTQSFTTVNLDEIAQRTDQLTEIVKGIDQFDKLHRTQTENLIHQLKDSIESLQNAPGSNDSPIHGTTVLHRLKAAHNVIQREEQIDKIFDSLKNRAVTLQTSFSNLWHREHERLREEAEKTKQEEERLKKRLEATKGEASSDQMMEPQPRTPEEGRNLPHSITWFN